MKRALAVCVLAALPAALPAQTVTDGVMMPRHDLCAGFLFDHDQWNRYWEGTLERDNGNIGRITTRSVTWVGNYGLTDRLNVIGMVPYVWTAASDGTLRGQSGFQDVTLALKWSALSRPVGGGSAKAIVVGAVAHPASDYTPDFYPLSLGSASRRASARGTLTYTSGRGIYANATAAWTWRGDVELDRSSYYTEGALHYGSEVPMPDVLDYAFSVGYSGKRLQAPVTLSVQDTRGGGDIRRQDMPFVSNRMNATRLDAAILYYLPQPGRLAVRLAAGRTLSGRNVGHSTSVQAGLLYVIPF